MLAQIIAGLFGAIIMPIINKSISILSAEFFRFNIWNKLYISNLFLKQLI